MTPLLTLYMVITAYGSIELVELQKDLTNEECFNQVVLLAERSELPFASSWKPNDNKTVAELTKVSPTYVCYYTKVVSKEQ